MAMKLQLRAAMTVSCMALALVWGSARADEVPLITGEHWTKSSEQLKKVYLIGIANVIQVETAFHAANPPSDGQSVVPRFAKGLKGHTLDSVREGRIDGGPLDAYWHLLIARHAPHLTAGIRVLASTPLTAMPAFVAAAGAPEEMVARLRASFTGAAGKPWFSRFAEPLSLEGFAEATEASFAPLLEWDREAREAEFERPA